MRLPVRGAVAGVYATILYGTHAFDPHDVDDHIPQVPEVFFSFHTFLHNLCPYSSKSDSLDIVVHRRKQSGHGLECCDE